MRTNTHAKGYRVWDSSRWDLRGAQGQAVDLAKMAAPLPIEKPNPDKIVQDILVAALQKVKKGGNAEIAAAADRYLELLGAVS